MNLSDLQSLDVNRIGSWPVAGRAAVIVVLCALVLTGGYFLDTRDRMADLERVQSRETELRTHFDLRQRKAANLEPLKRQLAEMQQSFGAMLRLLPNRTEIEGLLVDISQSGLGAGLEFELFKPLAEQPQEFYAIQPIQIRVSGTYHQFGEFIGKVAALPRIVTQHDLVIAATPQARQAQRTGGNGRELNMDMVARTYRYLDDEEIQALEEQRRQQQQGRRR